jgi:type VI secretion system secreted protein Hcp
MSIFRSGVPRLLGSALVGAVAAGAVLVLAGAVPTTVAQAAPVPVAQASCPAPVDPRAISKTSQAFAKIDNIVGDSTVVGHQGEIDITAVRFSLLGPNSGLCGGGARGSFGPLVLEKRVDAASVPLTRLAVLGTHTAHARISEVGNVAGRSVTFLTYDLSNVTVASVRQVDRGDTLTEEVELNYARIAVTFVPVRADGTPGAPLTFCFDLVTATPC